MNLRQLSFLFVLITSIHVNAQQVSVNPEIKINESVQQQEAKLSADQSLIISPNPLLKDHPILTITAVNVEIYSYTIASTIGAIVELENLAGRPDPNIINLSGLVSVGTYIIRFDTNSGTVSRKFSVI